MDKYLIDINIASAYLAEKAGLSAAAWEFLDKVVDATPRLSIITKIELLCWPTDDLTAQQLQSFLNDSVVYKSYED